MTTFPYQVGVGPSSGSAPSQELSVFESWTLSRNLDDGCSFSFVCPGDSLAGQTISELDTDVWLYKNGAPEQRFRILEVQQSWDADGRDDIQVTAVCYRRIFASRHVVSPLSYSSTSQGDIVWGLIQHAQAQTSGNLGITLGSAGPTVLRDRDYLPGANILEAITDLSKIENGITWDVDENLALQVSQADLYPLRVQPVILGVNAERITRPSGAALFGNVAIVSGDSQATSIVIEESIGLGADPRGRWERYSGLPSQTSNTALQEAADGLLSESQSPAVVWEIEVVPERFFLDSDYALGDFVTIVQPRSLVAVVGTPVLVVSAQVIAQSITVTADGDVSIFLSAIQTQQKWLDVNPLLIWNDIDASITWDSLTNTYLTI